MNDDEKIGGGCLLAFLLMWLVAIAGWITHIVVCIQNEAWLLLIAGAIAAPIGIIHGIGIWFGVF